MPSERRRDHAAAEPGPKGPGGPAQPEAEGLSLEVAASRRMLGIG